MTATSTIWRLEIFFAPNKIHPGLGVHVALDVQRRTEHFRTTEENAHFGRRVNLPNGFEDGIPVGTAEVGGRTKTGDSVLLGVGVVDHDVSCVVYLDLGGKILDGKLV